MNKDETCFGFKRRSRLCPMTHASVNANGVLRRGIDYKYRYKKWNSPKITILFVPKIIEDLVRRQPRQLLFRNKNTPSVMPTKILKKCSLKYIGSRCVDTHLSWLVYLSSVQASLTAYSYPTHYGCLSILLPILLDDSTEADNPVPSLRLWSLKMDFDASVKDVCTNLRNANCQNQFYEYTLCVDPRILAVG